MSQDGRSSTLGSGSHASGHGTNPEPRATYQGEPQGGNLSGGVLGNDGQGDNDERHPPQGTGFPEETVGRLQSVVEDYRDSKVTKEMAVRNITEIVMARPSPPGGVFSAIKSYVDQIESLDRERRRPDDDRGSQSGGNNDARGGSIQGVGSTPQHGDSQAPEEAPNGHGRQHK
ncbi:hypothetical protein VKT23_014656 [Stygiomarasmius scandens]|uniref:Uncharacterized protein n=1 Tax=Marasmiellus scandens TaxID=2682957 RepID=A0ABR1J378_9AGAR